MMLKIKKIIFLLLIGVFLTACGSDRAGDTSKASGGVLGVVEADSDEDGLSDEDEQTIYGTNPNNNDTDGDGLLDADEIKLYDTNATS
ncbi:MAG: Unknown protein, partial [uncultured Sulfurovum sp.]